MKTLITGLALAASIVVGIGATNSARVERATATPLAPLQMMEDQHLAPQQMTDRSVVFE